MRALEIQEKALPSEHPTIAESLGNLALLYMAIGRLSEAGPLLERALAVREKVGVWGGYTARERRRLVRQRRRAG